MSYRLDVESLSVESFDTSVAPAAPRNDPNDPMAPIVWTGCMSDCGQCTFGGTGGGTIGGTIFGTVVMADPGL